MSFRTKALLGAMISCLMLAGPAVAQSQDDDGTVAVKVNGHNITADEIKLAADDILPQMRDVPPKLRFAFVVEYLVERHLLAQEAVRQKLIDSEEYKQRIRFYQAKALRDAYFAKFIRPKVSDAEVKKRYDEEAAKVEPEPRARARHILVGSEAEAKEIHSQLSKGGNFEELAKKYSTDGSKDYGGDLGFFTAEDMVPEFSQAVFSMKPGQISQPVKTDFGWHVIKLEDIRPGGPQPFEVVRAPIRLVMLRNLVQETIQELRKNGNIEIVDPELAKLQEELAATRKALEERDKSGGKSDKQD